MEITEQEFIDFKEIFVDLSVEHFKACNSFIDSIENTNSPIELANVLRHFDDEIYEKLGGSVSDLEEEISDLEDEISNLHRTVDELREELDDVTFKSATIFDEMRYKVFLEHQSKYSPWEFEELLKNGKL